MRFNKLFVIPALLAVTAVAGCASKPIERTDGSASVNLEQEAMAVTRNLGCQWLKLPDPMYPAKGNDFACVADTFASVILFVEPSDPNDNLTPQVEKVKVIWKEWGDQVNMTDSKTDASRFIAYVAQRYFTPEHGPKLVDMFFGKSDKSFSTEKLDVSYTYRKQPALNLHRLEIQNTDPERRLYAYAPPHDIN